jgi:hypothetical protein
LRQVCRIAATELSVRGEIPVRPQSLGRSLRSRLFPHRRGANRRRA